MQELRQPVFDPEIIRRHLNADTIEAGMRETLARQERGEPRNGWSAPTSPEEIGTDEGVKNAVPFGHNDPYFQTALLGILGDLRDRGILGKIPNVNGRGLREARAWNHFVATGQVEEYGFDSLAVCPIPKALSWGILSGGMDAIRDFRKAAGLDPHPGTYAKDRVGPKALMPMGEDLHRAGSPLAGPGKWPAEWRVFLRNGKVTGVANYYGWTGDGATPQNAWNALAAAADGQLIADTACALSLRGAFMDEVFVRRNTHPATAIALEAWDADGFHATIDFLEARSGMMMLEAGPAHMPGGGGHPCAFAGKGVRKEDPRRMVADCEGVAFRTMPHVNLADPRTWVDGDHEGAFVSFEEAADLASAYAPLTDRQARFLAEIGVVSGPESEGPEI